MKKEDLIILILAILLLAGMVYTLFFGGEKSRHGVGSVRPAGQVARTLS
jgi:flagellar basal body-associated protein FliL